MFFFYARRSNKIYANGVFYFYWHVNLVFFFLSLIYSNVFLFILKNYRLKKITYLNVKNQSRQELHTKKIHTNTSIKKKKNTTEKKCTKKFFFTKNYYERALCRKNIFSRTALRHGYALRARSPDCGTFTSVAQAVLLQAIFLFKNLQNYTYVSSLLAVLIFFLEN